MDKQYRVSFTERINVGGMPFSRHRRHDAKTIIECLESVAGQAMSMSDFESGSYSPWSKTKKGGEFINRLDYRGVAGHLVMDQHNPAVMTLNGHFGGKAQSDAHISPYISIDICFGAPIGLGITDLDAYHVLVWLHARNYNVTYKRLPSGRAFYREVNAHEKNNAGGLVFPQSFQENYTTL